MVIPFQNSALCVLGLFALFFTITTTVHAQRSFECQDVWYGPSADNDVVKCLTNSNRIKSQWTYYIWPAVTVLVFLFALIGLAIIFICRCYNCCGCCAECINPQGEEKRRSARCTLWMWTIFVILWACAVAVLVIYGAELLMDNANKTLDNLQDGTVGYFSNVKGEVEILLTDFSKVPPQPLYVDLSAFDEVEDQLDDNINTIRRDYFKYFSAARIVSYCVGSVGVALAFVILVFAFCRCENCFWPVLYSGVYYLFAVIFSLLAIVFSVLWYGLTAGCGEVTIQYLREPGIFQWYLVPWCNKKFDFETVRSDVANDVIEASNMACTQLLEYCESNPATTSYDYLLAPKKIFMCGTIDGNILSYASMCTNLDDVVSAVRTTFAKPILSNTLCANQTGWQYQEACTVAECAERCVDMTSPDIQGKNWSTQVIQAASFAQNVSTALSLVLPLVSCNFIIDKVAYAVEQPSKVSRFSFQQASPDVCNNLNTASVMLGSGFLVGTLMFILGIYVLHRGSYLWAPVTDKV